MESKKTLQINLKNNNQLKPYNYENFKQLSKQIKN